jgi:hypothetical protein
MYTLILLKIKKILRIMIHGLRKLKFELFTKGHGNAFQG